MDDSLSDSSYRERYVAFLDILGFSQLTRKAHADPAWRQFLRDAIATLKATLPSEMEGVGFRFVQFSDSIVLSADRSGVGLFVVLNGCKMLVRNMLGRGVLLRGGIAAGCFHHDEHIMFGPALLDAYAFEQQGGPPHISIQDIVVSEIEVSLGSRMSRHFVTQDPWDLSPMLHTLQEFEVYDGLPEPGKVIIDTESVHLAAAITARATDMQSTPAIRAKWRWLQDYWNRSVSELGILTTAEPRADWGDVLAKAEAASRDRVQRFNEAPQGSGGVVGHQ